MKQILVVACVLLAVLLVFPAVAVSQYWPESPRGYELVIVPLDRQVTVHPPHVLVDTARQATGLNVDGVIEIEPGMQRHFALEWDEHLKRLRLVEYEIIQLTDYLPGSVEDVLQSAARPWPGYTPVEYVIEDSRIVLALGLDSTVSDDWPAYTVASLLVYPDGSMEELDRWAIGSEHCLGVYMLDLIGDGVLELLCPWTSGMGGGGGIDVLALVPTGGLATFGGEPFESSLYSVYGMCELIDYDYDGDWEIETVTPFFYYADGYFFRMLWTFDKDLWTWLPSYELTPSYYAEEAAFYRKLYDQILLAMEDPKPFRVDDPNVMGKYACTIDGELYSLWPAVMEDGTVDAMWLDVLAGYVEDFESNGIL